MPELMAAVSLYISFPLFLQDPHADMFECCAQWKLVVVRQWSALQIKVVDPPDATCSCQMCGPGSLLGLFVVVSPLVGYAVFVLDCPVHTLRVGQLWCDL